MAEAVKDRRAHRVQVNFSPDSYEVLKELAERRGKSISDVLRDAIAFEKWYQDTTDNGGQLLVERDDGRIQEVVRPQ